MRGKIVLTAIALGGIPHGQGAAGQPVFEAAPVKVVDPAAPPFFGINGGPGTNDPGRIRYGRMTMSQLVMTAWNVQLDQVIGPKSRPQSVTALLFSMPFRSGAKVCSYITRRPS